MTEKKRTVSRKPVRKKKNKILLTFIILLLIILISAGSYLAYIYNVGKNAANKAYEDDGRVKSELREEKVKPMTDNISILFVGVDDSLKRGQGNNHSRSDSLMLATLNNKEHSVKLLSIPRDSYVQIPAFGYEDKITHAHTAKTGVHSTIETVEKLLNVPVDYYFELNFDSFIAIVNALDGIEVDVQYKLDELDENDKRTVHLKPGVQTLNGREALSLARTRHYDNDFKRGERQQMILKAIAAKATKFTSFTKYDDLLTAVGDNMTTNMKFDEMKSLFSYIQSGMPAISSLKLEGRDDMSTGIYYFKLNDNSVLSVRQELQKQLGLPEDKTLQSENHNSTATKEQRNGSTSSESTSQTTNKNEGTPNNFKGSSDFSGSSNNGNGDYSKNGFSDKK